MWGGKEDGCHSWKNARLAKPSQQVAAAIKDSGVGGDDTTTQPGQRHGGVVRMLFGEPPCMFQQSESIRRVRRGSRNRVQL